MLSQENSTTVKNSSKVQRRNKLHKVTELTAHDRKALRYKPQPISKKKLIERNKNAFYFITNKGLLHEFMDFINAKTA